MYLKPVSTSIIAQPKDSAMARAMSVETMVVTAAALAGSSPRSFFWERM